jgi:hypothetical protein
MSTGPLNFLMDFWLPFFHRVHLLFKASFLYDVATNTYDFLLERKFTSKYLIPTISFWKESSLLCVPFKQWF